MMRYAALIALLSSSAAVAAPAIDTSTPQAMMASLYDGFRNQGEVNIWDDKGRFSAPDLVALEARIQKLIDNGQDEAYMDHDTSDFCNCEGTTEHPKWTTHVESIAGNTARATGIFHDGNETVTTRFSLVHTPKGWRVSDYRVVGSKVSFREQLQSEIAQSLRTKPHTY